MVDARAHWVSPHRTGIRHHPCQRNPAVTHRRIQPGGVCAGWQDHRHAIVDVGWVRVRYGGDDRAGFYFFALWIDPPIPESSESEDVAPANLEAIWLLHLTGALAE